jgi:hypothetical protein
MVSPKSLTSGVGTNRMNAKMVIAFLLVFAVVLTGLSQETKNQIAPTDSDGDVALHYDKEIALSDDAAQKLRLSAIELVESSNFNSSIPKWRDQWGIAKIQEHYRKTVAGRYLLISFKNTRKIKTCGGEISVTEIIIGLNGDYYGGPLYTIDDEGRIIAHSKYSGQQCIGLLEVVKEIGK